MIQKNSQLLILLKMEIKTSNENSQLFISYASEDLLKVMEYEESLRQNGLETWLDHREIKLSDSIVRQINSGIDGAKYALIFYSKFYKQKIWTQEEMAALIFSAIASENNRKVFVIRLDDTELPPLLSHRSWSGDTTPKSFAKTLSVMIKGQTEKPVILSESTTSNILPVKTISLSELDCNVCIILAKNILDSSSKGNTIRIPKGKYDIYVEIWEEALTYDLVADLKHWLNMIYIHEEYIKDFQSELAEGALGKFKVGFRIAMEQKILARDTAENQLRTYLEILCKTIILSNSI